MHLQTSAVSRWRIRSNLQSQTSIYATKQEKQLQNLFETGASDKEIGEALSVGISRVKRLRNKYGLLRRPSSTRRVI